MLGFAICEDDGKDVQSWLLIRVRIEERRSFDLDEGRGRKVMLALVSARPEPMLDLVKGRVAAVVNDVHFVSVRPVMGWRKDLYAA